MPRWGKTDHIHITVKKGVCDGAPIVRGTRTSVANIAGYYCLGLTPEEIQRELPHLGLAQIFDALAFYFDHRREIDLEMEQELEEIVSKEFPSDKYQMERAGLYLDEHIQAALAQGLRARGVDVLTTQEAGNGSLNDEGQLVFAVAQRRALLSYNKRHFAKLYYDWMKVGREHAGIILSDQLPVGIVLRRLMKLYFSLTQEDLRNRLEYLSAWR